MIKVMFKLQNDVNRRQKDILHVSRILNRQIFESKNNNTTIFESTLTRLSSSIHIRSASFLVPDREMFYNLP